MSERAGQGGWRDARTYLLSVQTICTAYTAGTYLAEEIDQTIIPQTDSYRVQCVCVCGDVNTYLQTRKQTVMMVIIIKQQQPVFT